jgi:predicted metalloprotease
MRQQMAAFLKTVRGTKFSYNATGLARALGWFHNKSYTTDDNTVHRIEQCASKRALRLAKRCGCSVTKDRDSYKIVVPT